MKPVISFVLQLSSSTAYENLEAVARNLLDGLQRILNSGSLKCSVFMDGPTIEMMMKVAKPLTFGKIRHGIEEGLLEILGGGYYDPMLPLFPEKLQSLQLDMHRKLLNRSFETAPQGYFNSSLVWEMGMATILAQAGYDYALVTEAALQDALGRSTPVSGWFTVEDRGVMMRVVPISDALSTAIKNDDLNWKDIAEPYCRDGRPAVVLFDLPPTPDEIVPFFERLVDFVETNDVQTWPVGYSVNQLQSEGALSYLVSAGRNIGLPSTAKTCREMLIRRPEINLQQKALMGLFHRGESSLDSKMQEKFFRCLMPAMSPLYFRDLCYGGGMQNLIVREWASRYLLQASCDLDEMMDFSGLRVEVCDFLLQDRKQIWFENAEISALLDFSAGGVLRSLNYKPSKAGLLNAWRDDGTPTFGFLDCLLPNVDLTAAKVDLALAGRENLLVEPYDYQFVRGEGSTEIRLLEEQGFDLGGKRGVFRVEKDYLIPESDSEFSVSYKMSNLTYMDSRCFFGTVFELGLLTIREGNRVVVDGVDLKWDRKTPILHPEAKVLELRDPLVHISVRFEFNMPATLFIGAIFGATGVAAPEVYQGIRICPFWRTSLTVMGEKNNSIRVSVSKG